MEPGTFSPVRKLECREQSSRQGVSKRPNLVLLAELGLWSGHKLGKRLSAGEDGGGAEIGGPRIPILLQPPLWYDRWNRDFGIWY